MYKGMGVLFADFISFFLKLISHENEIIKLFHFHRIFKNLGG